MSFQKISTTFPGADWASGTVQAFFKKHIALFVDAVTDVNDNDLEEAEVLYVHAKDAFYQYDSGSSAADDGDKVLLDNLSRRYLRIIPKLPSYTVAGLPTAASAGAGATVFVSDETGGAVTAFSDGTNWRRSTDRAVVS